MEGVQSPLRLKPKGATKLEFFRLQWALAEWLWDGLIRGDRVVVPRLGSFEITGKIGSKEVADRIRASNDWERFSYVIGDPFYSVDFTPHFQVAPAVKFKIAKNHKTRFLKSIKDGSYPMVPPTSKNRIWHKHFRG